MPRETDSQDRIGKGLSVTLAELKRDMLGIKLHIHRIQVILDGLQHGASAVRR
jgi:hypothetical protein